MTDAEKKADLKKVNGVFEMRVKNSKGKEGIWTVDMKKIGEVYAGPAKAKADVTISLSDDTFQNVRSIVPPSCCSSLLFDDSPFLWS